MIDWLLALDRDIFLAVNGWYSPWADTFMWIWSYRFTWIPLYLFLVGTIIYLFRDVAHKWCVIGCILGAFALATFLSDCVSTELFKKTICRLRPTHDPILGSLVHIVHNYRGGLYGFVSSHAANTVSIALMFCLVWFRKSTWSHKKSYLCVVLPLTIWVLLQCYSRMYLGVHYLSDIIGGLIVGTLITLGIYQLLIWVSGSWTDYPQR